MEADKKMAVRRWKIGLILFVLNIFLFYCGEKEAVSPLIEIHGRTMGTSYMVKVVQNDPLKSTDTDAFANEKIVTAGIKNILKKVNQQMSTWIKDSEISRFNRYGETGWFAVSADTAAVIAESLRVSQISNGAFDITVGPLINLWGFGPKKKERQIPGEQQIKEMMTRVGYQKLSVRQSPPSIKKENPTIDCDLSAIAKGFGVDRVAEYLDSKGFVNYLVEIGGEVRARGKNQKHQVWRVGIVSPNGSFTLHKIALLKDRAMATSGDYQNYFEKDGTRYSHTIDPTTGRPITHRLASVTVIHTSCMRADALATAINVLGPKKGYELAVKENLPVFIIFKSRRGDDFIGKMTPQFQEILLKR